MSSRVVLSLSIGGILLFLLFFLFNSNFDDNSSVDSLETIGSLYDFQVRSTGGMGEGMWVESEISGSVAIANLDDQTVFLPRHLSASIKVNGVERRDLSQPMIENMKQGFSVELDSNNMPLTIFTPDLSSIPAGHQELVFNQFKSIANYFFTPLMNRAEVFTPCLLGRCVWTLENTHNHLGGINQSLRRELQEGMALVASFNIRKDPSGLVLNEGEERIAESAGDLSLPFNNLTTWSFKRIESSKKNDLLEEFMALAKISIDFSLDGPTRETRIAQAYENLDGRSVKDIIDLGLGLQGDGLAAMGNVYTLLKSLLLIDTKAAQMIVESLKNLDPKDEFYITAINALAEDGSMESQYALLNLIEHYQIDENPNELEIRSLMNSLTVSDQPVAKTIDYLISESRWDEESRNGMIDSARLNAAIIANKVLANNDEQLASDLIGLASGADNLFQLSEIDKKFQLELIGNSGHSGFLEPVISFLEDSYSVDIQEAALMALRFMDSPQAFDSLKKYVDHSEEMLSSTAKKALQWRCEFCRRCRQRCL
jgi:hypothetical protein